MKPSGLAAFLKSKSAQELTEEIKTLHKLFPAVREYYQNKLSSGGTAELLARYKKIIQHEFFPTRGHGRARLSVARKATQDFSKLSTDASAVADILIFYVEMGVEFTCEYGDIYEAFYTSMESMYAKAARHVVTHGLQAEFTPRLKKIVTDTRDIGWGFHDMLSDIFGEYFHQ